MGTRNDNHRRAKIRCERRNKDGLRCIKPARWYIQTVGPCCAGCLGYVMEKQDVVAFFITRIVPKGIRADAIQSRIKKTAP